MDRRITNDELAAQFEELADLLEAQDTEHKPTAYRRAAESIREFPGTVAALADEPDRLREIDRVGDAIAEKIGTYVETGEIPALEEARAAMPVEMDALTRVEGVGPKTVGTLHRELGIETLDDLAAAADAGDIREVRGFGATTEANIAENVAFARKAAERTRLGDARPLSEAVRAYLADRPVVERVELAGSIRRWRPTVGDVDVLAASEDRAAVVDAVTDWDRVETVIEAGDQKASVRIGGVRVDCRAVVPAEFGAALQYFTGSTDHNVALRNRAIERDLKLNGYGVFDVSRVEDDAGQRVGDRIAGEDETGVYAALDLPVVPPEQREGRGEVEAAGEGALPDPIPEGAIRGDLHTHTSWSDGACGIEEWIAAAEAFGHDYLAITDHATGPGMVGGVGLTDEELLDQVTAVEAAATDAPIEVFTGVEANIDADGGLSIGEAVAEAVDIVVASPHSGLDGDGTDRLVAAIEHPATDILGHPTGRLLGRRSGLDVDAEAIAAAAADAGVAMEVNANPSRLDLSGRYVRAAVDARATVAIDTDAHGPPEFDNVTYGVYTARRGWATADDVLNAGSAADVRAFLG
ncbi:DNA polymerase/3'-5' exonuclease PolX [Halobacteriales archaeon SW_7_68_16]|nr:MAG: DNA polymerase/3'-5' exonuclease PolX [Halobacteriales archaeon SW_7_68_16]